MGSIVKRSRLFYDGHDFGPGRCGCIGLIQTARLHRPRGVIAKVQEARIRKQADLKKLPDYLAQALPLVVLQGRDRESAGGGVVVPAADEVHAHFRHRTAPVIAHDHLP